MKLIQCRFSSGQRVPLLVQDGQAAPFPKLVPFIYVQLKLRHRAYNTAAAHLRAIQAFYFYAKSRDLDIDEAILPFFVSTKLAKAPEIPDAQVIQRPQARGWYPIQFRPFIEHFLEASSDTLVVATQQLIRRRGDV